MFAGQEYIKRILRNIRFSIDDIEARLAKVEKFVVSDFETDSAEENDAPAVIESHH